MKAQTLEHEIAWRNGSFKNTQYLDEKVAILEQKGEVVFKQDGTTIAIWETEQGDENIRGEDYMNYMYNLYDTEEFESEEDPVEYDGGLCTGSARDAVFMAIGE